MQASSRQFHQRFMSDFFVQTLFQQLFLVTFWLWGEIQMTKTCYLNNPYTTIKLIKTPGSPSKLVRPSPPVPGSLPPDGHVAQEEPARAAGVSDGRDREVHRPHREEPHHHHLGQPVLVHVVVVEAVIISS